MTTEGPGCTALTLPLGTVISHCVSHDIGGAHIPTAVTLPPLVIPPSSCNPSSSACRCSKGGRGVP